MAVGNRKRSDLTVVITTREAVCDECGWDLGDRAWIILDEKTGALCLSCADLDHLVFLPAGSAALTRRARKHSTLNAIVLQWSRARKRYERQGVLVENAALEQAEKECLEDSDARERRRQREAQRRAEQDQQYIEQFEHNVRELFPGCPEGREKTIAQHACQKYSGRVGRSAAAKRLDEEAVTLAVQAHIRHAETDYDLVLASGHKKREARARVKITVDDILARWRHPDEA